MSSHQYSIAAEQVIGREGETATLLSRRPLNSELRVFGFTPRQLRRLAAQTKPREGHSKDNRAWNA